MVVDPNDYDVSDVRNEGEGDTSSDEDDDHGFVWVTDESEGDEQTDEKAHHQRTETSSSSHSYTQWETQPRESQQPLKWGSADAIGDDVSDERPESGGFAYQQTDDWGRETDRAWSNEADTQQHSRSHEKRPSSGWDSINQDTEPQDVETHDENETASHQSVDEGTSVGDTDESVADWGHPVNDSDASQQDEEAAQGGEDQQQQSSQVTIDPIGYDVEELHTVSESGDVDSLSIQSETEAHGFVWSDPPEQHRARIEDPTPEQYERLLTLEGIDPETVGDKPYLTRVSTEVAGAFVVDWMEFLACEAGTQGAIDAIERYREIGWFTESVEEELRNSIRWIDHHTGNGFEVFDRGDHLLSFAYVAKISSVNSEGLVFY